MKCALRKPESSYIQYEKRLLGHVETDEYAYPCSLISRQLVYSTHENMPI